MRTRYLILAVASAILVFGGCSDDDRPSTDQVEPAMRTFLVMEKAKTCGGTVTVDRISINKIGEFESKLDGYPVYATFSVACSDGSSWVSDDTSTGNFTSVVRKKASGEIECFMPEQFQQRRNSMERQTDAVPQDMLKQEAPKPIGVAR